MKIQKDPVTGYYINPNLLTELLEDVSKKYERNLKRYKRENRKLQQNKRKATPEVPEELEDMFWIIANKLINKDNFRCYWNIREEMKNRGFEHMYLYSKNFNRKKGNAFSYCTQICWNGFVQVINKNHKLWEQEKLEKELFLCKYENSGNSFDPVDEEI